MTNGVEILSAGYVVLDLVESSHGTTITPGGTAGNVALNLAWLGLNVSLGARLGNDEAGRFLLDSFEGAGVDTELTEVDSSAQTPRLIHRIDLSGRHRYMFSCPDCHTKFSSYRPPTKPIAGSTVPRVFFFDRAGAATVSTAEQVRANGGLVVFEPNSLGREQLTLRAAGLAHVLKISSERLELRSLLGPNGSPQLQILSQGSNGVKYRLRGSAWVERPAFDTDVVDTGGAGDWLTAGILMSLRTGNYRDAKKVDEAVTLGQALASISCQFAGAQGMGTKADPGAVARAVREKCGIELMPNTLGRQFDFNRFQANDMQSGCQRCLSDSTLQMLRVGMAFAT